MTCKKAARVPVPTDPRATPPDGRSAARAAPQGVAEGSEQELHLADLPDEMNEKELVALQAALYAGWRSMVAGRYRPAGEVVAAAAGWRSR